MSRSLNKITLLGNVGADPEVRTTSSGKKVAQFSLATGRTWKDGKGEAQEKTEWHKCVVWDKLADVVEKYVSKGDRIYVEGRVEYRQYEDKDKQTRYVTEVNVGEVLLLGGRAQSDSARSTAQPKGGDEGPSGTDGDDDLPF